MALSSQIERLTHRQFIFMLLAVSTLLSIPALLLVIHGHFPMILDTMFYAISADLFAEQLWSGDPYPRWLFDMNAGIGSPVFYFYAPFAFYLASLLAWVSAVGSAGIVLPLILVIWLVNTASGVAAYYWLKHHICPAYARLGALLYTFTLITIHYSVKELGMASLCGKLWIILILIACDHFILRPEARRAAWLAVCFAGLMLSHFFLWLLFGWIPLLYYLVLGNHRWKSVLLLLIAYGVGILLGSIYWLPAWLNRDLLQPETLYDAHFIGSGFNNLSTLFFVSLIPPAVLTVLMIRRKDIVLSRIEHFSALLCLVFLPFITPFSKPLWDMMPFLHYFQFPFRFGFVFMPFLLLLTLRALAVLPDAVTLRAVNSYLMYLAFMAAALPTDVMSVPAENSNYIRLKPNHALEYLPPWVQVLSIRVEKAEEGYKVFTDQYDEALLTHYARLPLLYAEQGTTRAQAYRKGTHIDAEVIVHSSRAVVQLRQLYYPGWSARLWGGKSIPIDTAPENGLIRMTLPEGKHFIRFEIAPPGSLLAFWLSLGGVFGVVLLWLLGVPLKRTVIQPSP